MVGQSVMCATVIFSAVGGPSPFVRCITKRGLS